MTICMDVYDLVEPPAPLTCCWAHHSSALFIYDALLIKVSSVRPLCIRRVDVFLPWGFRQRHKDCEHSGASDSCSSQLGSRQTAQLQAATEGQGTSYSILKMPVRFGVFFGFCFLHSGLCSSTETWLAHLWICLVCLCWKRGNWECPHRIFLLPVWVIWFSVPIRYFWNSVKSKRQIMSLSFWLYRVILSILYLMLKQWTDLCVTTESYL